MKNQCSSKSYFQPPIETFSIKEEVSKGCIRRKNGTGDEERKASSWKKNEQHSLDWQKIHCWEPRRGHTLQQRQARGRESSIKEALEREGEASKKGSSRKGEADGGEGRGEWADLQGEGWAKVVHGHGEDEERVSNDGGGQCENLF